MLDVDVNNFDRLRIGLASSEQIRQWSRGEVKKPETINYRTLKPEMDGLFCEKIFGPNKDWECYCGRYKRVRFKGIVCERCGVEVTRAKVRRDRMGHVELAAPVSHIWYSKGAQNRLGYLLDIGPKHLEKVLYFASSIISRVDEEARETDMAVLQDELQADLEGLDAEMQVEIDSVIKARDRIVGIAKGEIEPEEGDQVDENINDPDYLKKVVKEAEQEVRDIEKDFKARAELYQEAFDTFQKLTPRMLIADETLYREMKARYGDYFRGGMGAEAVKDLLESVDLDQLDEELRTIINESKGPKADKAVKRLRVVSAFRNSTNEPSWMILDAIPVIPPALRPMVQLDGGRFATSDLNDLYRRVINRNNRLKKLLDLGAPEIIVNNEKRLLQEAVDSLFDNGRRDRPVTGSGNRPLKSISDMLRGKQGRFRQNLLGKRVDYSGRSVIVVGPELKLHQCGLPKTMALELFKPFVMKRLVDLDYAQNIKKAKRMVDRGKSVIWDVLEEVIADHPVMLNRAPTLHRLGIQAFEPVLVEGKAIRIHPLVCTAFNADFDGDQMAVHLPLSVEAQAEARVLMLSTNNIKSPAHGRPLTTPTQDMVIGLYYLTAVREDMEGHGRIFGNASEAILAYDSRSGLDLQAQIEVRLTRDIREEYRDGDELKIRERKAGERLQTSVGRLFFNRAFPEDHVYCNFEIDRKGISRIVEESANVYSTNVMSKLLDELKWLGFHYATRAGLTVSVYDAKIPPKKKEILEARQAEVEIIDRQYERGLITADERHRTIVDVWTKATDEVGEAMAENFDKFNPIFMMANSGARGNIKQIRQLAGMRGLMANPKGDILDRAIMSNFREGLSVLEYFVSTHGARKGLADTAVKTADSGYLTRKLVDVAQDVIVRMADCETDKGLEFTIVPSSGDGKVDYNLVGRCLLEPAVSPETGEVLAEAGDYLATEAQLLELLGKGVQSLTARTVATCQAPHGICQHCYGWDLASRKPVDIGTAVGIIAAQSIGEPGTQLTMRTFHTGGVAGEDITHGLPRVTELFEVRNPKGQAILAEISGTLRIEDDEKGRKLIVASEDGQIKAHPVSRRSRLKRGVEDGATITAGQQMTEGSINPKELLRLKGPMFVLRYVVTQVQEVYRSQGVDINDKHIEVIATQMLRRVTILDPGDTEFLPGQLVDKHVFEAANKACEEQGLRLGDAAPALLGITKASSATDSYLSAASFQETTKALTDAAINGKEDHLIGLKENVIIGKLIPAATGMERYRKVNLTHKGQKAEWDYRTEGPLPEFAPDDLLELQALLPAPSSYEHSADAADLLIELEDEHLDDESLLADVSEFVNTVFEPEAPEADPVVENALEMDAGIIELGLSVRTQKLLITAGMISVGEVVNRGRSGLLSVEGIGPKAVAEIEESLSTAGLELKA